MDTRSPFTLMATTAACLVVLTTGCSKSAADPAVAALTTPASSLASSVPASAAGSVSAPSSSAPQKGESGLLAYSQCMRSHGVPDFPDPIGNSLQLKVSPGSDLDPNSAQMQAAQKACKSLSPAGAQGGTVSAAQQAKALKYSQCMRSHGLPNFPDPTFSGGGVQLKISDIDPNSPQFAAAQKACQALQPIGGQTNNSAP